MAWRVVVRPEEHDIERAAQWYETRSENLGKRFITEVLAVLDALTSSPFLNCRRHPLKNIRWRYPAHFPYRVIYEVLEPDKTVIVAAVIHAARHDQRWKERINK